ncbi:MAG: hypothetical protein QXM68_01795 [Candidatus Aenigmatarchaeota archaeon]|nr:hypothetical protein [Candidatus Aenigmarchaeota archaeon]
MKYVMVFLLFFILVVLAGVYATPQCPKFGICSGLQVDLCSNRENCGECGNECEGPIDGGYCCSQGRCTDNTGASCNYKPSTTISATTLQPTTTTLQKSFKINVEFVCANERKPSGFASIFYAEDIVNVKFYKTKYDMSQKHSILMNTSQTQDAFFGFNASTKNKNFISLEPFGNSESSSLVYSVNPGVTSFVIIKSDIDTSKTYNIAFKAPDDFCLSQTNGTVQTTRTTQNGTTQTTRTPASNIPMPTVPTTVEENARLIIKLKGDYDQYIEYSDIFLNTEKIGEACRYCPKCELTNALEKGINTDVYCNVDGFIDVKFVDSNYVDDTCNSVHMVCINIDDNEHCCQRECDMHGCENSVSFDCDNFNCVELSDLVVKDFYCKGTFCAFRLRRNVMNSTLQYLIVGADSKGIIHYKSSGNITAKSTGWVSSQLLLNKNCDRGKKLSVTLNIFDSKNNLLYNQKISDGLIC